MARTFSLFPVALSLYAWFWLAKGKETLLENSDCASPKPPEGGPRPVCMKRKDGWNRKGGQIHRPQHCSQLDCCFVLPRVQKSWKEGESF